MKMKNILITGAQGTGKTVFANKFFKDLKIWDGVDMSVIRLEQEKARGKDVEPAVFIINTELSDDLKWELEISFIIIEMGGWPS